MQARLRLCRRKAKGQRRVRLSTPFCYVRYNESFLHLRLGLLNYSTAETLEKHYTEEVMDTKRPPGVNPMKARIKMVGFLFAGAVIMVAHDRFYAFLANKPYGFGTSSISFALQQYYSAVGNIFALIARFAFSLAIGTAFIQLFWMVIKRKERSVAEVDSAMGVKDSPFGFSSLLTWRSMFFLPLLPALAVGNAQIVVLSSGAVRTDFAPTDSTCKMRTVDLTNSDIGVLTDNSTATEFTYLSPAAQTRGFVAQVIMSGEGFSPLILHDQDFASLVYNVSFRAPALNCTNVTDTFDFANNLALPSDTDDLIVVWNATYTLGSGNLVLNVATRELSVNDTDVNDVTPSSTQEAVTCTMYNATYLVQVNQTFTSDIFTSVLNLTLHNPLANVTTDNLEEIQMNALADSFARLLNGTAAYNTDLFDFTPESPIIVYSPLGETDRDNPWFWTQDMVTALPNLMGSVSSSLLSGSLSETGSPTLKTTETECQTVALFFIYDRPRLLWPYASSLIVTAICVLIGFYAIAKNGTEETLDFSRILRAVVNESILDVKDRVGPHTVVQVTRSGEIKHLDDLHQQ